MSKTCECSKELMERLVSCFRVDLSVHFDEQGIAILLGMGIREEDVAVLAASGLIAGRRDQIGVHDGDWVFQPEDLAAFLRQHGEAWFRIRAEKMIAALLGEADRQRRRREREAGMPGTDTCADEVLEMSAAAARLHVSLTELNAMAARGEILTVGGGEQRVPRCEVERLAPSAAIAS